MTILFEMETSQVQLIRGGHSFRRRRFFGRLRKCSRPKCLRLPCDDFIAFQIKHRKSKLFRLRVRALDRPYKRRTGREFAALFKNRASIAREEDSRIPSRRQTNSNANRVTVKLHIHRGMRICIFRRPDLLNRIPVLAEGFCLIRLHPREVRLIVGVGAGHQLDIGSVFVSQISIPRVSEFGVSPGPQFLTGRNKVIRSVNHSRPTRVVVSAAEIVLRLRNHIRSGYRNIFVPGDIGPRTVIDAVIAATRNRE